MKLPAGAVEAVKMTVGLLVNGEYETLRRMTQGKRLTVADITLAITQYGRTLKNPPAEAYADLPNAKEGEWEGKHAYFVEFPLWTEEEGRSDLELDLILIEVMDGVYGVELNGIRVF